MLVKGVVAAMAFKRLHETSWKTWTQSVRAEYVTNPDCVHSETTAEGKGNSDERTARLRETGEPSLRCSRPVVSRRKKVCLARYQDDQELSTKIIPPSFACLTVSETEG